jgi:anti-sigma B factor antagonist
MTIAAPAAQLADKTIDLSDTFDVVVAYTDGRMVAAVHGEVDIATAPTLRSALMNAVARIDRDGVPAALVVDLTDLRFIDASGLHVLLSVAGRARRAGSELVLRAPSRAMLRVLEVTGLAHAFTIVASGSLFGS